MNVPTHVCMGLNIRNRYEIRYRRRMVQGQLELMVMVLISGLSVLLLIRWDHHRLRWLSSRQTMRLERVEATVAILFLNKVHYFLDDL